MDSGAVKWLRMAPNVRLELTAQQYRQHSITFSYRGRRVLFESSCCAKPFRSSKVLWVSALHIRHSTGQPINNLDASFSCMRD